MVLGARASALEFGVGLSGQSAWGARTQMGGDTVWGWGGGRRAQEAPGLVYQSWAARLRHAFWRGPRAAVWRQTEQGRKRDRRDGAQKRGCVPWWGSRCRAVCTWALEPWREQRGEAHEKMQDTLPPRSPSAVEPPRGHTYLPRGRSTWALPLSSGGPSPSARHRRIQGSGSPTPRPWISCSATARRRPASNTLSRPVLSRRHWH